MDLTTMTWLNPPLSSSIADGRLSMTTGPQTDFWQGTYYGYHNDNGHFFHAAREGDFTLEARFRAQYDTLYDQAGLMIRHDAATWMKCGVELTDGVMQFSVVVTNTHSDWSAFRLEAPFSDMSVRVTRLGDALFIQYRPDDDGLWRMARLAYFPPKHGTVSAGLMACSPQRSGLEVTFDRVSLTDPVTRDIH